MWLDYLWLIILAVVVILFVIVFCTVVPINVWFKAKFSGVPISARMLASLKLRKIDCGAIMDEYIYAKKAGVEVAFDELATHYISGGNIRNVVDAMIGAKNISVDLSVDTAKAIDLSGENVNQIVQQSITPKEINSPVISAFCADGVEIKATLALTVKVNLAKFLGGAKEDTIIARAVESAMGIISSAKTADEVLKNPDLISKFVCAKRVDAGTIFDLLNVSVVSIETGRNLQKERTEYEHEQQNKEQLFAKEQQRASALLEQEELKAKVEEENLKKAKLEAEVPKALMKAFENGKMEALDYYKMQNIIADTNMRQALASQSADEKPRRKVNFNINDSDE